MHFYKQCFPIKNTKTCYDLNKSLDFYFSMLFFSLHFWLSLGYISGTSDIWRHLTFRVHWASLVSSEIRKMKTKFKIVIVYALILLAYSSPLSQEEDDDDEHTEPPASEESDESAEEFVSMELEDSGGTSSTLTSTTLTSTSLAVPTSTDAPPSTTTMTQRPTRPTRPRPTRPPRPLIDAMAQHLQNLNTVFVAVSSLIHQGWGALGNLGIFGGAGVNGTISTGASGISASGSVSGSLGNVKIPVIEPPMDDIPTIRAYDKISKLPNLNYLPDLNENEVYIYRLDWM